MSIQSYRAVLNGFYNAPQSSHLSLHNVNWSTVRKILPAFAKKGYRFQTRHVRGAAWITISDKGKELSLFPTMEGVYASRNANI